jgi:hypothetical protein
MPCPQFHSFKSILVSTEILFFFAQVKKLHLVWPYCSPSSSTASLCPTTRPKPPATCQWYVIEHFFFIKSSLN